MYPGTRGVDIQERKMRKGRSVLFWILCMAASSQTFGISPFPEGAVCDGVFVVVGANGGTGQSKRAPSDVGG